MSSEYAAAWLGKSKPEIDQLRTQFQGQLEAAMRTAYPTARIVWSVFGKQLDLFFPNGCHAWVWEPNIFWDFSSEADRIAGAVAAIRAQLPLEKARGEGAAA